MTSSPYLVGIAGASCSGKTQLATALRAKLCDAFVFPLDAYYLDLAYLPPAERAHRNFDVPEALDWDLIRRDVQALAAGTPVNLPQYDFATHARTGKTLRGAPCTHILVEGLFALHDPVVSSLLRTRVFVDIPLEDALERRIARDVAERGRTRDGVIEQFEATVRPMTEQFVLPDKDRAHIVVSGTSPVETIVEAVLIHIRANQGM